MPASSSVRGRWSEVSSWARRVTKVNSATIWMAIGTAVIAGLIEITVFAFADSGNDWLDSAALLILALQVASGALMLRYIFNKRNIENKRFPMNRAMTWVFLTPLLVLVVLLPLFLSGAMSDDESGVVESIFLYALISFAAVLLGFLMVPFVLLPLELIGRGLLSLVGGKPAEAGLLLIGLWIASATVFIIAGSLSLDGLPAAWLSWPVIAMALVGIPGDYTVVNPAMLWVARIAFVVLLAPVLAIIFNNGAEKSRANR